MGRKKEPGVALLKGKATYIVSHTKDWATNQVYQKIFKKKKYGGTKNALDKAKDFARKKAKEYGCRVEYWK